MKEGVSIILLLLLLSCSKEYHVSVNGSDENPGTRKKPFRTIMAAATVAQPGDVITVHEGVYRERVNPPRGGLSGKKRITYRAMPGQRAEIKGSEIVTGWTCLGNNVWMLNLPDSFFGSFNPFTDLIWGDWFNLLGREHHTAEVYLNGKSLYQAENLSVVFNGDIAIKPEMMTSFTDTIGATFTWFSITEDGQTTIWCNFQSYNPNEELVEINLRESCFYPDQPGINYITVDGFIMSQAATQWAAPTAEQPAIIGTHWSKGWIIQNNTISDSKCVGITLGKDRATGHNVWSKNPSADGAVLYNEVVKNAIANGWNKDNIGSHIVRNNIIFNCGVAGICGSLGAINSEISNNHIYDIYTKRLFAGPETGGIKIHAAIDMIIRNNRIENTFEGIWLDWMAQGTRVSGNLCFKNDKQDFFAEVNHGPYMVDNNIFLSDVAIWDWSNGGAYIHNLIAGKIYFNPQDRETPFFKSHSTELIGIKDIKGGDTRYINNILVAGTTTDKTIAAQAAWGGKTGYGLNVYDTTALPMLVEGNVYLMGAEPYFTESEGAVYPEHNPSISLTFENNNVYLEMNIDSLITESGQILVTTDRLGKTLVADAPFMNPDGSKIKITTDYTNATRNTDSPSAGPFEKLETGRNKIRVW